MTLMLASVASLEEADQALGLGADLIDLKDPTRGALGAWPPGRVREAVGRIAWRRTTSATSGVLPMCPRDVATAAATMAATGVDIVKIGFFGGGDAVGCIEALRPLAQGGVRLVAVMMADQGPDLSLVGTLAAAGFYGVMLDTADKRAGNLRAHRTEADLHGFVGRARAAGLLAGLAGSLALADIAPLAALGPDYLGFRGALCRGDRSGALDPARFAAVRAALGDSRSRRAPRSAVATAGAQVATQPAAAGSASTRLVNST
jgi:uncharacterized protein (UPF0264 family)